MTTIIIKNADFSGGRLVGYKPPIADAQICSFFGGSLDDSVRNFGTGAELVPVGTPTIVDDFFIRPNITNYLQSAVTQGAAMTVMAVVKPETNTGGNLTDRSLICGTEAIDTGTDRSGFAMGLLASGTVGQYLYMSPTVYRGVTGSGTASITTSAPGQISNPTFDWQFVSITVNKRTSDNKTELQARSITTGQVSSVVVSTETDYTFPARTIRIGANYRTDAGAIPKGSDMAHLTVVPRVLTLVEQTVLYESVKRRMTAFGHTI
jgi:hypothetical protein